MSMPLPPHVILAMPEDERLAYLAKMEQQIKARRLALAEFKEQLAERFAERPRATPTWLWVSFLLAFGFASWCLVLYLLVI